MNKSGHNLTKRQLKAIPLILEAKNISEGTKKARVSRTTFYEWLKDQEFKYEFIRQRQDIVELALHELKTAAGDATRVLRGLMESENENIQLRASTSILEHIGKFIELEKLEARIEEIERSIEK